MDLLFGKGLAANSSSMRYACVTARLQAHMLPTRTEALNSHANHECSAAKQKETRFYRALSDQIGIKHFSYYACKCSIKQCNTGGNPDLRFDADHQRIYLISGGWDTLFMTSPPKSSIGK